MIHELGVKPGPVQVPHYIPNWIESIHAGVERAECCRDNEGNKRKITSDASSNEGKRRRINKSFRQQKSGGFEQYPASASSLDVKKAAVNEKKGGTEKRPCRRQRKRKRLSLTEESKQYVDLVIAKTSPCHGAQTAACNLIATNDMHCVRSRMEQNASTSQHTGGTLR